MHAEFDEWLATRHQHRTMVEEVNGAYVEAWERDNEVGLRGAFDADGPRQGARRTTASPAR